MDIAASGQAPASSDQELAKVLESMNNSLTTAPAAPMAAIDEPADTSPADDNTQAVSASAASETEAAVSALPEIEVAPVTGIVSVPSEDSGGTASADSTDLESIKKDALTELRPLVDKLNLSPEDKFDTLLLIIRSTDDRSLVPQAHEAAKSIEDDTRRAEALLDVIKEIDYFSQPQS